MVEKKIVIDNDRLSYKGLFDMKELYRLIDTFFHDKGYEKRETRNKEFVSPEGKYLELWLEPYKKITDYAMVVLRLQIIVENLREVVVEKEQHKKKMHKGEVLIIIDGFLVTDYENRWEGKPEYVFIRTLFDKFIYRRHTQEFEGVLIDESEELKSSIKSFLNLYRY